MVCFSYKVDVSYVNVCALRRLKQELAWAIDKWLWVISNTMLFVLVKPHHEYPWYYTRLRQSRGQVLTSRILFYKCRWGLTVFYHTKQLFFWYYQWLVSGSTDCFWCTSTLYGLSHKLVVKPLRYINTL